MGERKKPDVIDLSKAATDSEERVSGTVEEYDYGPSEAVYEHARENAGTGTLVDEEDRNTEGRETNEYEQARQHAGETTDHKGEDTETDAGTEYEMARQHMGEVTEGKPRDVEDSETSEYERARQHMGEVVDPESRNADGRETSEYEAARPDEAEADGEKTKGEVGDDKLALRTYDMTTKFDREKEFNDVKEGDVVLIDTPLEGAKTGEVVDTEKAWTGTLHLKVDTGANQYSVSPYEDEFSEKYVACIADSGSLSSDLLANLSKTELTDVDVGKQVMLDVPNVGPVRGTVAHKAETETQGTRVDVNTGPVSFTLYERPSPANEKEAAMLVGAVR